MDFDTPVILLPGMEVAEIDYQINLMWERSQLINRWLMEEAHADEVLDLIDSHFIDTADLLDHWEST